jgi:hypothetical protein
MLTVAGRQAQRGPQVRRLVVPGHQLIKQLAQQSDEAKICIGYSVAVVANHGSETGNEVWGSDATGGL